MLDFWFQNHCDTTCPWTDKEDAVHTDTHTHTMECCSAMKKNETIPFAETWMALEVVILSEVSQRKTSVIWYHLHIESKKKMIQMNLFTKQKQTHRHRKQTYSYQRGNEGGTN